MFWIQFLFVFDYWWFVFVLLFLGRLFVLVLLCLVFGWFDCCFFVGLLLWLVACMFVGFRWAVFVECVDR